MRPLVALAGLVLVLFLACRGPAPDIPDLTGTAWAGPGAECEYIAVSIDPGGEDLAYRFAFDGEHGDWSLPVPSGTEVVASMVWPGTGVHSVAAQAGNRSGATSAWSETLRVSCLPEPGYPDSLAGRIETNSDLEETVLSLDGRWLYATDWDGESLEVYDAASLTRVTAVFLGLNGEPGPLFISPDGQHLLVGTSDQIAVVNTSDNSVERIIDGLGAVSDPEMSPDSRTLYIIGRDYRLFAVDMNSSMVRDSFQLDDDTEALCVNPVSGVVYAITYSTGEITCLRPDDLSVCARFAAGMVNVWFVTAARDGRRLYVAGEDMCGISVVSTHACRQIGFISFNGFVECRPVLFPSGRFVMVGVGPEFEEDEKLAVCRNDDLAVAAYLPLDDTPTGVHFSPDGMKMYVCYWNEIVVYRFGGQE